MEARQEFHDRLDEVEDSLGSKAPNVIGTVDNFATDVSRPQNGWWSSRNQC